MLNGGSVRGGLVAALILVSCGSPETIDLPETTEMTAMTEMAETPVTVTADSITEALPVADESGAVDAHQPAASLDGVPPAVANEPRPAARPQERRGERIAGDPPTSAEGISACVNAFQSSGRGELRPVAAPRGATWTKLVRGTSAEGVMYTEEAVITHDGRVIVPNRFTVIDYGTGTPEPAESVVLSSPSPNGRWIILKTEWHVGVADHLLDLVSGTSKLIDATRYGSATWLAWSEDNRHALIRDDYLGGELMVLDLSTARASGC